MHCRSYLVMFCMLAILASLFIVPASSTQEPSSTNDLSTQSSPRVVINKESDFNEQGWPGNGTEANPYLIEGLTFYNLTAPCIVIGNVSAFVAIRHCNFEDTHRPDEVNSYSRLDDIWANNVKDLEITECSFVSKGFIQHFDARNLGVLVLEKCSISGGYFGNIMNGGTIQIVDNTVAASGVLWAFETTHCLVYNNRITVQGDKDTWFVQGAATTNISANVVYGNVEPLLSSREVILEDNIVTGRFVLSLQMGGSNLLSVRGNTFGEGGFSATDLGFISGALQNAVISDNYVHGAPILFLKNQNQTIVDLEQVAQLIAYKCEGLRVSGFATKVGDAVILEDCKDSSLSRISTTECDTGVWIDNSKNISITSFSINYGSRGVEIYNSENVSLIRGEVLACSTGAHIWDTKGILITACRFANNSYGIEMTSTSYSTIYNNTFDCSYRNVYVNAVDPTTDRWDYNGTGNTWNDYYWGGTYLIGFDFGGTTIADFHPQALNPDQASLVMAGSLTLIASLIFLFGLGPYALLRGTGEQELRPERYDKYLLISGFVLVTLVPTLTFFGSGFYGNSFWGISSSFYSIWSDFGYIYVNGPILLSYGAYMRSASLVWPSILGLFSELAIFWAWKLAIAGRRNVVPLILAIPMLTFESYGLIVPLTIGGLSTNLLQIPLPIGIVAVYFLFRKLKPIETPSPEIPKRVNEIKLVCPECGAVYYYRRDAVIDGSVICQNCNKRINIQDSLSNAHKQYSRS